MEYKTKIKIITWNVRGLNEREKILAIRHTFFLEKPNMICLQETNLRTLNDSTRKEICGGRLNEFRTLEANQTRGDILVAWQGRKFSLVSYKANNFSLSVNLRDNTMDEEIKITSVYGPSRPLTRDLIFQELQSEEPINGTPWLIYGDFNTTLQQQDKNSNTTNSRWPAAFADLILQLGLIDLPMAERRYTWSNTRVVPSLAKLYRFLLSIEWITIYLASTQRTLPNTNSDHNPIIYEARTSIKKTKIFRFENLWLKSEEFVIFVKQHWESKETTITAKQLQNKFIDLQKQVLNWTKDRIENIKRQILVCRNYMGWFHKV